VVPPIPGLDEADPLTSDTVWDLDTLPQRLAIIGGGNIGCELGQAFARLGAQVTILEGGDRILGKEDPEASELVHRSLVRDGVTIVTGSQVKEVRRGDGSDALVLDDGKQVQFDRVLVSVGRNPGTRDLGLERAGVELDDRGYLRVDSHLRSTNPDVWAAGDVTGHAQFTHVAGVHGSLAASNAVLGLRRRVDTTTVPRVTFTDPEVAAVGVGTESAADNADLHVVTREHGHVDRAVAEGGTEGFSKLVVDAKGRVLGATVVGPRAGETLGELSVAVKHGLRTRDLAGTTHAYPTYNDGAWNAAIDDVKASLSRPTTARAIALLAAGRRRWVSSAARERLLQARSR
jgi:pyruvate/2-oxoglutarate dehydrogenase complex dihydrolipoamide dehydrogenase (E3) component